MNPENVWDFDAFIGQNLQLMKDTPRQRMEQKVMNLERNFSVIGFGARAYHKVAVAIGLKALMTIVELEIVVVISVAAWL